MRKHLQTTYLAKAQYPAYIKNSQKSTVKKEKKKVNSHNPTRK